MEDWEEELGIKMSFSDDSDKLKKIRECNLFIVVASDEYFTSAQNFAECFYAKELGKPFRVIIRKGTKIAKGYFEGVKDIKFYEWETEHEKGMHIRELLLELKEESERR